METQNTAPKGEGNQATIGEWANTGVREQTLRKTEPAEGRRKSTRGATAFFEYVGCLDRDPDISELGDLYQEWQDRHKESEQSELVAE